MHKTSVLIQKHIPLNLCKQKLNYFSTVTNLHINSISKLDIWTKWNLDFYMAPTPQWRLFPHPETPCSVSRKVDCQNWTASLFIGQTCDICGPMSAIPETVNIRLCSGSPSMAIAESWGPSWYIYIYIYICWLTSIEIPIMNLKQPHDSFIFFL